MGRFKLLISLFFRFLRFYWKSQTIYDIHSPHVFEFTEKVIEDNRHFYAFTYIESFRDLLKKDERWIKIKDYGAGSKVNSSPKRQVKDVIKNSAIAPATGRKLFKIVHLYKPEILLEMGTSLGISSMYQAAAALKSDFITVEGCPETAQIAAENFEKMGVPQIELLNGPFHEVLPVLLAEIPKLDYLYLDGDHSKGASLQYFELCLAKAHSKSVFIIADIHWSAHMEEAWEEIKKHPKVALSIDLFHFGVLFFDHRTKEKQHYKIVPKWWKPWHLGIWK
ncbi:MAG: class I SAM-dependent methyltransferase [Saprospiraceae bacterium]|nr:class I SAM-dependent methyltransferase [Saprospiraceae bacterium]